MHPPHKINTEIIKLHQKVYTCLDLTPRALSFTHSYLKPCCFTSCPQCLFFPSRDFHPFLLEEPSCTVSLLSPLNELLLARPCLLAASVPRNHSTGALQTKQLCSEFRLLRTLEPGTLLQFPRKTEKNGGFKEMKRRCSTMAPQQLCLLQSNLLKIMFTKCQKDTYW